MFPVLFSIPEWSFFGLFTMPEFTLYTYGLMLSLAFGAGILLAVVLGRQQGIDSNRMLDLGLVALLSSIIGARLLYVATDWESFAGDPLSIITQRFGFVYYGGLLVGIIAVYIYIRVTKLDSWNAADVVAPAIALGQAIGRLGCFAQGCCFGRPTDLPWGMVFPRSAAPSVIYPHEAVHPTQLYEAALTFILFAALMSFLGRRRFKGQVFSLYLMGYGLIRFSLEFLRGDFRGAEGLGLSVSQWISLGLILLGGFILFRFRRDPAQAIPAEKTGGNEKNKNAAQG